MLDISITAEELLKMRQINPGLKLLDVREEFELEEIPLLDGAVHVPLGDISVQALLDVGIDKKDQFVVYCHSGNRSKVACQVLYCQDYLNVKDLDGGIETQL